MTPLDNLIARIDAIAARATHQQETEAMQTTPPRRQPDKQQDTNAVAIAIHLICHRIERAQLVRRGVKPQTEDERQTNAAYN